VSTLPSGRARGFALLGAVCVLLFSGCSYSYTTDQGRTMSPHGASYSYKVPPGFFTESSTTSAIPGRENLSGVFYPTGAAVIRVSEQTLLPPPTNVPQVQASYMAQAARWQNVPSDWQHTTVDGAPALEYELSGTSGDGRHEGTEEYAVFKGSHLVYVSCAWESGTDRGHALAGCRAVLKSLRIAN
jgi:hypothetical protein